MLHAGHLQALELGGQVQQVVDLLGSEVQQSQKAAASDVDTHNKFLLNFCSARRRHRFRTVVKGVSPSY